jgi:hypothetical protein
MYPSQSNSFLLATVRARELIRLLDKVELKAQLLLLGVYIYSPRTVLLIVHGTAE